MPCLRDNDHLSYVINLTQYKHKFTSSKEQRRPKNKLLMIMANFCIISLSRFLIISLAIIAPLGSKATITPAIFVLGDSLVDVGTNNFIPGSQIRADFPYNGIDFPSSKSTGRYSNGFNGADYLSKLMGFKRSPQPFLYLTSLKSGLKKHMFRGVNFASGGAGILDATGQAVKVVPMSEQIKQFATVCSNLTATMGQSTTEKLLKDSFFLLAIGSNDIFAYFLTNSTIPPSKYLEALTTTYESQIKALYNLGARKFGVVGTPAIGCCPRIRLLNKTGGCLEPMNAFSKAFYANVDTLLYKLASKRHGMKYSLGNAFEMTSYATNNPHRLGFKNVDTGCCGSGKLNAVNFCMPTSNLCSKRNEYLFWDLFHPSQKAAKLAARTLYGGSRYVKPINFAQLAA